MEYVNQVYNLLKNETNLDKYNEIIYDYCIKVNWDDLKIEQLGNLINKNVKGIRQIALDYFEKISSKKINIYESIKSAIKYNYREELEFCEKVNWDELEIEKKASRLNEELKRRYNSKYTNYYSANLITSRAKEQEKTLKILLSYLKLTKYNEFNKIEKEIYLQKDYLEVLNPALLASGIKSYRIGKTTEEREITLKYMYEIFEKNGGLIGQIIEKFKLEPKQIMNYIHEYIKKNLERTNLKKISSYKYVLDKLKEANTEEEIIELIESSKININYLKNQIHSYLIQYEDKESYEKVKEVLMKKLDIYSKYLFQKNKEEREKTKEEQKLIKQEENLKDAIKYVSMFVDSKEIHSIKEFCIKVNLEEKEFKSYVDIVKNYNQELYEKYKEKIDKNIKQKFAILANKVKKIISEIKNGVEENGIKREFDIIDYYQITSLNFDDFTKIASEICTKQELILLKKFIKKNIFSSKEVTNIEDKIMKEQVEFNFQKDKNGMPIPGTGEIFPDESKIEIINYLKENNIPLNMKTYTVARRRYINGTLKINQDTKNKVLSKKQETKKEEE